MSKSNQQQQQSRQKPQGKCIFCDGHGMTKQHIWPDWISRSDFVKSYKHDSNSQVLKPYNYIHDLISKQKVFVESSPKIINRQGTILSRKIRLVCKNCNNGWMSRIEDYSKNIILALQAHENIVVNTEQQEKLAIWIALMTIVAEFTDASSKAIPYSERRYFYDENRPPIHWGIWISKYIGKNWVLRYKHHGLKFPDYDAKNFDPDKLIAQWQSSTFVLGGLLMHVVSTSFSLLQSMSIDYSNLIRIWPPTNQEVNWASCGKHSDESMDIGAQSAVIDALKFLSDLGDEIAQEFST